MHALWIRIGVGTASISTRRACLRSPPLSKSPSEMIDRGATSFDFPRASPNRSKRYQLEADNGQICILEGEGSGAVYGRIRRVRGTPASRRVGREPAPAEIPILLETPRGCSGRSGAGPLRVTQRARVRRESKKKEETATFSRVSADGRVTLTLRRRAAP